MTPFERIAFLRLYLEQRGRAPESLVYPILEDLQEALRELGEYRRLSAWVPPELRPGAKRVLS